MKVISDLDFGIFLKDKPLYTKILATESFAPSLNAYTYPTDYDQKVARLFCKRDNEYQTFKLSTYNIGNIRLAPPPLNGMIDLDLPPFWDKVSRTLDLTIPIEAECQLCTNKIYYLLNILSDGPFDASKNLFPNIYLQKVGQNPAFEIKPEKEIVNYLLAEDKINYSKALANLSVSYGIGAFAYFRRIIENEIKKMIKDIINLTSDNSQILIKAYSDYESDHQMNKLISTLNSYIPNSLRDIGDNPIKLLYDQLSGGIHEFSDEECMNKALNVDIVLRYTIKKLNEEKMDINIVRKAMVELRNKSKN